MLVGTIKVCNTCGEPYRFQSGGGGPMQSREEYWCPNCGAEDGTEKTAGVPQTFKLTPEELAEWKVKVTKK